MVDSNNKNVKDPQSDWGGKWTEKKLDAFAKYVSAYLTIMKNHPYWKTIYFDGFAGCGVRTTKPKSELYQQLMLTDQEERLYKGAAERVLSLPNNLAFDYYYFIDSHEESLNKLEKKLVQFKPEKENKFQFRPGDCNKWLIELSNAMKNDSKLTSLVFLDPFGMQIDWDSIESLKETRTDIWILIPTGVIVNRLLDKSCKLDHSQKLQAFFGLDEDEIVKYFYQKDKATTLFGDEEEIIRKVSDPIKKIASLYTLRLNTIWTYVTKEPLVLLNSKKFPIYHLVFASNNNTALKIAKQIIDRV